MKKLILFLAVLLPIGAMAQMYPFPHAIERVSAGIIEEYSQKVVAYNDEEVITLSRDTNGVSSFYKTVEGSTNVERFSLPNGLDVLDFQIFEDTIYFCGENNNTTPAKGFLSWISYSDLFSGQNISFDLNTIITNPNYTIYSTISANKLTVYRDGQNRVRIGLVGLDDDYDRYYFFDYIKHSDSQYRYYTSTDPLTDIVNTNSCVVVLGHKEQQGEFFLIKFDKSTFANQKITYTNTPSIGCLLNLFLVETMDGTDNLFVAHSANTNEPYIYLIDIATSNVLEKQSFHHTLGKPIMKDIEFCPYTNRLLLLTGTRTPSNQYVDNAVYEFDFTQTQSYQAPIRYYQLSSNSNALEQVKVFVLNDFSTSTPLIMSSSTPRNKYSISISGSSEELNYGIICH